MAMSDINNDKLNDLIVSNEQGTQLTAYYYSQSDKNYSTSAVIDLPSKHYASNVIVTKSANMLQKILVVALDDSAAAPATRILIYKQSKPSGSDTYKWEPDTESNLNNQEIAANTQPTILDINAYQV